MNYNHHPRNRECNETHYNPLSGDRSDHQRRKVISDFPRLADGDRQVHDRSDHRRTCLRRRKIRSILLLFTRFQRPQEPPLHLPHSRLPAHSEMPRISINPRPSPPIKFKYCTQFTLQPDGDVGCRTPQFVKHLYNHRH